MRSDSAERILRELLAQAGVEVGDAVGLATLDLGEGIAAAVRRGALAAHAIATGAPYTVRSLPRYSIPHIVANRFQARRFRRSWGWQRRAVESWRGDRSNVAQMG